MSLSYDVKEDYLVHPQELLSEGRTGFVKMAGTIKYGVKSITSSANCAPTYRRV